MTEVLTSSGGGGASAKAQGPVLYIGAVLPSLTETFVYREVLGLRERGWNVPIASVHAPALDDSGGELASLASEALPVYGLGAGRILARVAAECAARPVRTTRTLWRSVRDAVGGRDLRLVQRPKVLVQALAAVAVAREARSLGLRRVHAHMAHVPATIGMYLAQHLGVAFSFTGHANDLFQQRSLLAEKLSRADFVAAISHWHREFYRSVVPDLTDAKMPIVRCGVDTEAFRDRGPARAAEELLISVGRLVEKKGFHVLIRALPAVLRSHPDVRLHLIGEGPERERLESLVRELGLESRVRFLGARSNDEVRRAVGEARVFALPCVRAASGDKDGIPVVLMEAMALGVPVVAGALPAIRELVDGTATGLLCEPGSVEDVERALLELFGSSSARECLGSGGRRRVLEEFSAQVNLARLEDALRAGARAAS